MIFDVLDQKMKDMKALRQREERRANQKQQAALDQKYRAVVEEAERFSDSLACVRDTLEFLVSEELRTDCLTLLDELEAAVSTGYAVQESVEKAKRRYDAKGVVGIFPQLYGGYMEHAARHSRNRRRKDRSLYGRDSDSERLVCRDEGIHRFESGNETCR